MVEIKTNCQKCIHAEVCNKKEQFEEWQQRMIRSEGNESNIFRADVSCYYFREEKPNIRTINLYEVEGKGDN